MSGVRIPYPDHFGSLAQLVEQLAFNQLVVGSNPTTHHTGLLGKHESWMSIRASSFYYLPFNACQMAHRGCAINASMEFQAWFGTAAELVASIISSVRGMPYSAIWCMRYSEI